MSRKCRFKPHQTIGVTKRERINFNHHILQALKNVNTLQNIWKAINPIFISSHINVSDEVLLCNAVYAFKDTGLSGNLVSYKSLSLTYLLRPCHSSGSCSSASHICGPGSRQGQVVWDLWWTKWHWGRFPPSTSVPFFQFSFHRLLHIHRLSSGAGTIGQIVADVPSGLSLTSPQEQGNVLPRWKYLF
jgi:hypothetical protein